MTISRIRNHLKTKRIPQITESSSKDPTLGLCDSRIICVQGASGPRLSSTWWVSQIASAGVSGPSSLGLTGAARLRKSCRILNETVTSPSSSFWGITLMKKPILLDFLKATTLRNKQRVQVKSYLTHTRTHTHTHTHF